MRGYGDSEKPSGRNNYTMNYLVDDIKQIVEDLGMNYLFLNISLLLLFLMTNILDFTPSFLFIPSIGLLSFSIA